MQDIIFKSGSLKKKAQKCNAIHKFKPEYIFDTIDRFLYQWPSNMSDSQLENDYTSGQRPCPVEVALNTIGGKWKGVILQDLDRHNNVGLNLELKTSELRNFAFYIADEYLKELNKARS